jgi:5-formyltetrahydrofolate cyclo-ligase
MSMLPEIPDELRDQLAFRAKRELRKRLRAVRSTMPPAAVAERSARITERVLSLDVWKRARTVALFSSMPDEVQCASLVMAARESEKRVALPVVVDEAPGLIFRAGWDGAKAYPTVMSAYGIDEPDESAPTIAYGELDLVLVPALAVDDLGHRIGYGGGYYDRTLPLCAGAAWVAVAFDFQMVAEVPTRAGDVAVHAIATDKRLLHCAAPQDSR